MYTSHIYRDHAAKKCPKCPHIDVHLIVATLKVSVEVSADKET